MVSLCFFSNCFRAFCARGTGREHWYQFFAGHSMTTNLGDRSFRIFSTYSKNVEFLNPLDCRGSRGLQPCFQEISVRLSRPKTSQTSACPVPYILCVRPPDHAAVALIKTIASNKKTAVAIWMPLNRFLLTLGCVRCCSFPYQTVVLMSRGPPGTLRVSAGGHGVDSINSPVSTKMVCLQTGLSKP